VPPVTAVPLFSPELRRGLGRLLALTLLLTVGLAARPAQAAATNLAPNPGLESVGADGFPTCWEKSGQGDNAFTLGTTTDAHSGGKALRITITQLNSGDRKAMMLENAQCAPRVSVGRQYDLSVYYKSTTAANAMTLSPATTARPAGNTGSTRRRSRRPAPGLTKRCAHPRFRPTPTRSPGV